MELKDAQRSFDFVIDGVTARDDSCSQAVRAPWTLEGGEQQQIEQLIRLVWTRPRRDAEAASRVRRRERLRDVLLAVVFASISASVSGLAAVVLQLDNLNSAAELDPVLLNISAGVMFVVAGGIFIAGIATFISQRRLEARLAELDKRRRERRALVEHLIAESHPDVHWERESR